VSAHHTAGTGPAPSKRAVQVSAQITAGTGGVTNDFTKPNNTIALHPLQPTHASEVASRNSGGTAGILPAERKKVFHCPCIYCCGALVYWLRPDETCGLTV